MRQYQTWSLEFSPATDLCLVRHTVSTQPHPSHYLFSVTEGTNKKLKYRNTCVYEPESVSPSAVSNTAVGERDIQRKRISWKKGFSRWPQCDHKNKTIKQSAVIAVMVDLEDQARVQKQCCWRYRLGGSGSKKYKRLTVSRERRKRLE